MNQGLSRLQQTVPVPYGKLKCSSTVKSRFFFHLDELSLWFLMAWDSQSVMTSPSSPITLKKTCWGCFDATSPVRTRSHFTPIICVWTTNHKYIPSREPITYPTKPESLKIIIFKKVPAKKRDILASLGRVVIHWSLVIQDHLGPIQPDSITLWRCIGRPYYRISSGQFPMTNNNEISRKSCRWNNSSVQQPQKPHLSSPYLPSQPPPLPPKHHQRGTCCIHPQSGFGLTHLFGHSTDWFYQGKLIGVAYTNTLENELMEDGGMMRYERYDMEVWWGLVLVQMIFLSLNLVIF